MRRGLAIALVAVPLFWSTPAWAQQTATDSASEQAARAALTKQIVELGLTEKEARDRVAQLPYHEVRQLVEKPQQVGMGGIQDRTLIIIALILIVPSILLLIAI